MNENKRDRGPVGFPPPVIYIAGLMSAWLAEGLAPTPDPPTVVAVMFVFTAVVAMVLLDGRAMTLFRRNRTGIAPWHPTTRLVTDGPYRFSRNPMYLGMTVTYTALSLAFGLLWGLALLPAVVLVVNRAVIQREEKYLEERYGDEYLRYKHSVRRWL